MYECFWQLFSGFLTLPLHQTHTHTHTHTRAHTHTHTHTHSPRLLWQDQTLLYGSLSGSLGLRHSAELFLVTRREEERHRKRETDRKRRTQRGSVFKRDPHRSAQHLSDTRYHLLHWRETPLTCCHPSQMRSLSLSGWMWSLWPMFDACGLDGGCFSVRLEKNGTSNAGFDGWIRDFRYHCSLVAL